MFNKKLDRYIAMKKRQHGYDQLEWRTFETMEEAAKFMHKFQDQGYKLYHLGEPIELKTWVSYVVIDKQ